MAQPQIPEGDLSAAMTSLHSLSDDELKKLIDDEDHFDNFVQALPQVKKWEAENDMLMASHKSLAEVNLTFEPKLKEGKGVLMELYERARSLTDELETKRAQLESLSSRTSLDTTYALLQTAAAESEEMSDTVSESYLNGQIDTENFMAQFIPIRTTAHLRRLKAEKMGEIVSSQRNRASFSSVPYPTSPPSMPMPGMGMM